MKSKEAVKKVDHISPSQLDQFEACEVRWDYIYNKGIKMAPGFAMLQGSSFHHAEQVNFTQKIKKGKDLKLSVVKDAFAEDFKERVRARRVVINNYKIQVSQREAAIKPNDAQNQALKALTTFHGSVAPHIIPLGSEVQGEIEIKGMAKPYTMKYAMDLVGKPIEQVKNGVFRAGKNGTAIHDFKLIGKAMAPEEIDRSYQYPAYVGAYSSINKGKLPDQFSLIATVKTQVPKIQVLSVRPRAEKVNWLLSRITRVIPAMEEIKQGKRLPKPAALHPSFLSPCKPGSCGLWTICKMRPQ